MNLDLYKKKYKIYKKKYTNLKFYEILNLKQIGGDDNINIDGINFGLFYRFKNNGYKYLVVRSKIGDLRKFFVYYRSNSQGLWRLCYSTKLDYFIKNGIIEYFNKVLKEFDGGKGSYTATTLVHCKLQVFIDKNYDKIDELPKKYIKCALNNCFQINDLSIAKQCKEKDKHNSDSRLKKIFGLDRIYESGLFEDFDKLDFHYSDYPYKRLIKQLSIIKNNNTPLRFGLIKSGILTVNDKKEIKINLVPQSDINSHRKNRKKIIAGFNNVFIKYCKIEKNSLNFLGNNFIELNKKRFQSKIYSIIIYFKNNLEKRYKIYFRHIDIDKSNNKYCSSNIILVPLEVKGDKINEYGLYNKYINTEFYTSKPFDYKNQAKDIVSKINSPNKVPRTVIGTNYYNICDIVSDIFPGYLLRRNIL